VGQKQQQRDQQQGVHAGGASRGVHSWFSVHDFYFPVDQVQMAGSPIRPFLIGFIIAVMLVVGEALIWPKKVVKKLTKEDACKSWFAKNKVWIRPVLTLTQTAGATNGLASRAYTLKVDLTRTLKESETTLTAEDVAPLVAVDALAPATSSSVNASVADNVITYIIDRTLVATDSARSYTSTFDVAGVQVAVIIEETDEFADAATAPTVGATDLFEVTFAVTLGHTTFMTDPEVLKAA
jgi:hypothetical protein